MKQSRQQIAALYAEEVTSPEFMGSLGDAYQLAVNSEGIDHCALKEMAEEIIYYASSDAPNGSFEWEARRGAALVRLYHGDESLGPIADYFEGLEIGSGLKAGDPYFDSSVEDLGKPGPVRTNASIVLLSAQTLGDPQKFLGGSVSIIQEQYSVSPKLVGPENYATAIGHLGDKFTEFSASNSGEIPDLSEEEREQINGLFRGFFEASRKDPANIIEVTNLLKGISRMPRGTFPQDQIDRFAITILENMPNFDRKMIGLLFNAVSNINGKIDNPMVAEMITLAVHLRGNLDNSKELASSLRAIGSLGQIPGSDRAFETLATKTSGLELAKFDYDTSLTIIRLISRIINGSLLNNDTVKQALDLGESIAKSAIAKIEDEKRKYGEIDEFQGNLQKVVETVSIFENLRTIQEQK